MGGNAEVRFAVIFSHKSFNEVPERRTVIVVPLAPLVGRTLKGPTAIPISKGVAGLEKSQLALCHEITTIDRSRLTSFVGVLPDEVMVQVESGAHIALHL